MILKHLLRFAAACIDAGAALGVVFTIAGLLGRFNWLLELFTQLKLPLTTCFLGYAIYKVVCRKYKTAVLALLPLLINVLPPLLLLLPQEVQPAPAHPTQIRILQANILSSNNDSESLLKLIEESNPDVVVLQETNRRWLKELKVLKKRYPVNAAFPREDNFGAAIYCRHTNATAQIIFLNDPDKLPMTRVTLSLCNKTITISGVHPLAPLGADLWKWRNRYTVELAGEVAEVKGAQIVTGDFNNTPWTKYYKQFIDISGLLDSSQGRGSLATWPTHQALVRIPLDHCFHSQDVIISSRRRGPPIGSDHFPILIDALF